jgi:hypothetical protein
VVSTSEYTAVNRSVTGKKWTGRDVEGSSCGLIRGNILAFGCRDWEELWTTSAMITSVPANIQIGYLLNVSQKYTSAN